MFTTVLLLNAPAHADDLAQKSLYQLAGWSVVGLPDLPLNNLHAGDNYLSGEIHAANVDWTITLFKAAGQTKANIALTYDESLRLSTLNPALIGSPVDVIQLNTPTLLYVPNDNSGKSAPLPPPLAQRIGKPSITLPKGLRLGAQTTLLGDGANLLRAMGLDPTRALAIAGSLDPSLLSGAALKELFWQNLDLSLDLGVLEPHWKPRFLAIANGVLHLKGIQGADGWGPSMAVVADVSVLFGGTNTLTFGASRFEWRSGSTVQLSTDGVKPPASLFALPLGISLDQLTFAATIGETSHTFSLDGGYRLNSQPQQVSIQLTGEGAEADYLIAISGDSTLNQLTGWSVPAIGDSKVTSLVVGKGFVGGNLNLASQPWTVAVFKPEGQSKTSIFLSYDKPLTLATLMPALAGTPLDSIQLDKPNLVMADHSSAGATVALPPTLAEKTGVSSLTLPDGLGIHADASVIGEVAELMQLVGINQLDSLLLSGKIDPTIFTSRDAAAGIGQAFLAQLDLHIPLRGVNVPGLPGFVAITPHDLVLRGSPDGKGISAGIATDVTVHLPQQTMLFDSAILLGKHETEKFIQLAGSYHGASWTSPLGIPWLTLREVTLDLALGKEKHLAIAGLTDVGDIKSLTASVVMNVVNGQIGETGIELLGADIPFSAIPGLNAIPGSDKFGLRDLYLTTASLGGTFKTSEPALRVLNGLESAVFKTGTSWNVAVLKEEFSFGDILALPPMVKSVLDPLRLKKAAFVISQAPFESSVGQLPDVARKMFNDIYGSDSGHVKLDGGLQLVSAIDLGSTGQALMDLAPIEGNPVFSGGIGGLGGGTPSLTLQANIPTLKMPEGLAFIQLPKEFTSYFFLELTESGAGVGVGLDVETLVHAKPQPIDFVNTIRFEAGTDGGLEVSVQGKTDSVWYNALGIQGLNFRPGTRLEVSGSVTGSIGITFVGITDMGSKEVELIGSASFNVVAEVIDKGAFEGKIDSISMNDIMALTNTVVTAGGGKPLQPDFPNAALKNADVAFASPGVDIPEMHLAGGGIRIGGDLWVLFNDGPLGHAFAQIDGNGIIMDGALHDFTVGPIALANNNLDAKAVVFPPESHFILNGHGKLFGESAGMEVALGLQHMSVHTDLDMGQMLQFDFLAGADILPDGFSQASLAQSDLGLSSTFKADLAAWMNSSGMQAVQQGLGGMSDEMSRLNDQLSAAQDAVNHLDSQIDAMRRQVESEKSNQDSQIRAAEKNVDDFAALVNRYAGDINSAQSHIHKCNYTVKTCLWRSWITGKCTKYGYPPDLKRNAQCVSDNIYWGGVVAEKETLKTGAAASKRAADQLLDDLRKGLKTLPTDADPRVAELIAEREGATLALQTAQKAVEAAKGAADAINNVINIAKQPGVFRIKDSLIQGSLKKAILGTPSVIGIDLEVLGADYYNGFAFSFTDPAFNSKQMEALALFVATTAANDSNNTSTVVKQYLHDAYVKKHDEIDDELKKALAANGLE